MLKLVVVLVLAQNALGWKPVVGPASYSHITNHHPVMGTQNTIIDSEGGTGAGHSVSYHGHSFAVHHETEPEALLLRGEHGPEIEDAEGRVLSGSVADYESKYIGGGIPGLASVRYDDKRGARIW